MNKDTEEVWDAGVQTVNDVLQLLLQAWCLEQVLLGHIWRRGTLKKNAQVPLNSFTIRSKTLLVEAFLPDHRIW